VSDFVPRPIVEPGGILLVGVGLSDADLLAAIDKLYGESSSLTILISRPQQAGLSLPADEVWVYAALGASAKPRGAWGFAVFCLAAPDLAAGQQKRQRVDL
jgi:hypothetical protein